MRRWNPRRRAAGGGGADDSERQWSCGGDRHRKSGHVGHKIAATLASTGTPAFFVHPAEASHGDMGMITADDVVIALSNSGEVAGSTPC